MQPVILHGYQRELKAGIYNAHSEGNRNVLAVSGTGSGKSVIMSDIVLDYHNASLRTAVIAHRNELVSQMSMHVAKRGIPHRIIGSDQTVHQIVGKHREAFGRSFINPTAPAAVVGVDTMMSRRDDLTGWAKQVDLWLGDEWHHCIGNDRVEPNKWGRAVQMFTNARGVGFTATPSRADGQGLGRLFDGCMDTMVLGPSMRWLIDNNFLSDYEIVCPESDLRVDDAPLSKDGDWSNKTLRKAAKKSRIVGDVVTNYAMYAFGRRAIVFATDVETAEEMAQKFNDFGIRAASVNGNSLPSWREQCIRQFSSGELPVLINVDLFDEGFDVPACDVVIMARPTASLAKYLQMVGRAMRYIAGKVALIIDHVSNVIRHHLPDKHRDWTLGRREKRAKQKKDPDELELTRCNSCTKVYEVFRTECPHCGFEKPLPEPKSRSLETVEGDLILLTREMLNKMRAATVVENPSDVASRVAYASGPLAGKAAANRQFEKLLAHNKLTETIAQWAAIERMKGFTDREIHRKFYFTTGQDVLSALDSSKQVKDMEALDETIKGWYL